MSLTMDEIARRLNECYNGVDPGEAFALATQFQAAASILFARAGVRPPSGTSAEIAAPRAPERDRLLSINDAATRLNKNRSWLDRHGRSLGLIVCDPTTGRAMGVSERALEQLIKAGTAQSAVITNFDKQANRG